MSLIRGMDRGEAIRGANVLATAEEEHARNVETGQGDPVVMARLEALESKLVQVTQLLVGLSGSLGGHHSLEPSPRENTIGNMPNETGRGPKSVGQRVFDTRHHSVDARTPRVGGTVYKTQVAPSGTGSPGQGQAEGERSGVETNGYDGHQGIIVSDPGNT